MSINILIIGSANDSHLIRFKKYFDAINHSDISIDIFNINGTADAQNFRNTFNITRHFPQRLYAIKFVNNLAKLLDLYLSFGKVGKYDLINIHYLTLDSFFLLPFIKRKSRKILISPWGSDVYRIKNKRKYYWTVYHYADFVSAPKIKFRDDVRNLFSVPSSKFIDLGFGSEIIDYISNNQYSDTKVIKRNLGCEDSYIITCGYSRSKAHHHSTIIDALFSVKKHLPQNVILYFPMTYGIYDQEYLDSIEQKLSECGFRYHIFKDYLSNEQLFHIEKATDLFIHIQDSDAFSATIQEYLLCDTAMINGSWLRYPELEKYGIPYLLVDQKEELPKVLTSFFMNKSNPIVPKELKGEIANRGWSKMICQWYQFYASLNQSN